MVTLDFIIAPDYRADELPAFPPPSPHPTTSYHYTHVVGFCWGGEGGCPDVVRAELAEEEAGEEKLSDSKGQEKEKRGPRKGGVGWGGLRAPSWAKKKN